MANELQGKVALVTGAGRGIGKSTALILARAGADVILAARTQEQLAAVAVEIEALGRKALAVPTDVTDEQSVDTLFARSLGEFGRVDILVNNAGASNRGAVTDLTNDEWQWILQTNATGTFLCSRAVVPAMRAQKWGRIVNIVSGNGRQGQAFNSAYSASKFAVMGFSQSLAHELRDDNVTVSCVLPGPTDTPMRAATSPDEDKSLLMHPDDVAEVILFLVTRPDHVIISEVPVRPRVYMGGVA